MEASMCKLFFFGLGLFIAVQAVTATTVHRRQRTDPKQSPRVTAVSILCIMHYFNPDRNQPKPKATSLAFTDKYEFNSSICVFLISVRIAPEVVLC